MKHPRCLLLGFFLAALLDATPASANSWRVDKETAGK